MVSTNSAQAHFRMSQIAAAEEEMRAAGKIDSEGHLKKVTKAKKHEA
jgi:hypothetical protein